MCRKRLLRLGFILRQVQSSCSEMVAAALLVEHSRELQNPHRNHEECGTIRMVSYR